MLLDVLLQREGIAAEAIEGYDRIEFTHTAVAALVADGSADCGLGVLAAARALGCDFIPIAEEPYELAIDASQLEDRRIAALLEELASDELRKDVEALGGYDASRSGDLHVIEPAA
jgi:putative molybdopterin biosynthesis protein